MKNSKTTLLEIVRHAIVSHPDIIPSVEQMIALYRKSQQWNEVLNTEISVKDKFTKIYQNNLWGNPESRSGTGSTLVYTQNLRSKLPGLIKHYDIKSVFDAPCGDLNWMRHVLPNLGVKYVGGDIVEDLILKNKTQFESEATKFILINLIDDSYPTVDLMICRDFLFHMSYEMIKKVLVNFVSADIPYLLTTTHITDQPNRDIKTGDFRLLNLFESPYFFDGNPLERIDDWMHPEAQRQMCLWDKSQVTAALHRMV